VVPIEGTEKLDREGLAGARDGIWKAAMKAWRNGEIPVLPDELAEASEEQNANYQEQDPWLPLVAEYLEGKSGPVKVEQVLSHLEIPKERQSPREARKVRELAESLGWSWGRRRDGDTRAQGLWPPKGHPKATQATQAATQAEPSQGNGSDLVATQATQKNGNELTIKENGTQGNIPEKREPELAFLGGIGGHSTKSQSGTGKSLGGRIGGLGGQIGGMGGHPTGSAWDGGDGDDPHWPARRVA
jgi:predicted P-loop ATPase